MAAPSQAPSTQATFVAAFWFSSCSRCIPIQSDIDCFSKPIRLFYRRSVYVSNVAPAATNTKLSDFFSFCGRIVELKIQPAGRREEAKTFLLVHNWVARKVIHFTFRIMISSTPVKNKDGGTDYVEYKNQIYIYKCVYMNIDSSVSNSYGFASILSLSVENGMQEALIEFETDAAAKTALLLKDALIEGKPINVISEAEVGAIRWLRIYVISTTIIKIIPHLSLKCNVHSLLAPSLNDSTSEGRRRGGFQAWRSVRCCSVIMEIPWHSFHKFYSHVTICALFDKITLCEYSRTLFLMMFSVRRNGGDEGRGYSAQGACPPRFWEKQYLRHRLSSRCRIHHGQWFSPGIFAATLLIYSLYVPYNRLKLIWIRICLSMCPNSNCMHDSLFLNCSAQLSMTDNIKLRKHSKKR